MCLLHSATINNLQVQLKNGMNPAREVSSRGKRKAHPQIRNFTFLRRGLLSDEDFSKFFSILGKFYFKGKIKSSILTDCYFYLFMYKNMKARLKFF